MKIEKVNENQIRCTLTKEDLASRQIKLSELAYGTEKAKSLFRDMMQQANHEFGFEAEDIPLMIEAIPLSTDCIVLIITKVEDPEELDTRFSRFAPSVHEDNEADENNEEDSPEEVMDLFRKIQSADTLTPENTQKQEDIPMNADSLVRLFRFETMHTLLSMISCINVASGYGSALYRNIHQNCYLLMLTQTGEVSAEYNKLCNMISEYGSMLKVLPTTVSYLAEHCEIILAENALQTLTSLANKNTIS